MDNEMEVTAGLSTKDGVVFPLEGLDVQGDIMGRGAKVRISQRFCNREDNPMEAIYKFPLPESAAICGFRALVGDRVIEGEIEERDKAFKLYDDALLEGDGAQLLDEDRPNIFTISIGNIKPHSSVIIDITYVILLDTHNSEVRFSLPTTISPRYIPSSMQDDQDIPVDDIVNPPFLFDVPYGLALTISIHDKKGISSIESPSHNIITKLSDDVATVSLSSSETRMDRDFILNIAYGKGFLNKGYIIENENESFIQIDLTPEKEGGSLQTGNTGRGREIVFVLDCSGSMRGKSIDEARKALEIMVKALNPGTYFNIYRFGSHYERLYSQVSLYDEKSMAEALRYLSDTDASLGGTDVLSPLEDIYGGTELKTQSHRDIILITDGEIGNEEEVMSLVKGHSNMTNFYTVGIGSGPNEFLINGLARGAGGSSELIAPNERIEPKVLRLFSKIMDGCIRDLQIEWTSEVDQAPSHPVLFNGQGNSIFARLNNGNKPFTTVRITGQTNQGGREWLIDIDRHTNTDLPLQKLWARERIRDLEENSQEQNDSWQTTRMESSNKNATIEISKSYGILSRATSFIGIERRQETEKSKDEIILRKVPTMLTKGWGESKQHINYSLATSREYCYCADPNIIEGRWDNNEYLLRSVDDLELSLRSAKCLKNAGICLIGEIVQKTEPEMLKMKNFGRKSLDEIKEILAEMGFSFGMKLDFSPWNQPTKKDVYSIPSMSRSHSDDLEGVNVNAPEDIQLGKKVIAKSLNSIKFPISKKLSDDLLDILSSQKAIGGFDMNDSFKAILNISLPEIEVIADRISLSGNGSSIDILITMLTLLILEQKFGDRRREWDGVVMKSREWLQKQVQLNVPMIEQQALESWLSDYIESVMIPVNMSTI